MLRTALVAVMAGAVLTGCGIRIVHYEFEDDKVVAEEFASVKVDTGSGDVTIRHQEGLTETKIHRKVRHPKDRKPTTDSHQREGSTLVLRDCGDNCTIDYTVLVPKKTITVLGDIGSGDAVIENLASVDLHTGSGDITVKDIEGDVRVNTGSGDFEAARIKGAVTAKLGSGNMRLDKLSAKAVLDTGSGDITGTAIDNEVTANATSGNVDLTFASSRAARVSTGSGDVTLKVPSGSYKVLGESGSGDRTVSVTNSPDAATELNLSTGSGNVRVLPF